jgi:UDP-N-acetylmuramyl-tripeptide synthetase
VDLAALIEGLGVRVAVGRAAGVRVCDLTEDSRTALPGSLFVARAGLKADGRAYATQAVEAGAVAVLTDNAGGLHLGEHMPAVVLEAEDLPGVSAAMAERFWGAPTRRLALVGITGTNGKSTTAHLVHRLLNASGVRCGLIGTVETDDGREVGPSAMTTPPAIELSRTLATMVEHGCAAAAMEVSSHALDQGRAAGLRFAVGVFTNLTRDHLDYHKTMDAYAEAKRRLFTLLPADGLAVTNADDPRGAWMAEPAARRVLCSMDAGDWRVRIAAATLAGIDLEIHGPEYELRGRLGLVGAHNAMNALKAVAAADEVLRGRGVEAAKRARLLAAAIERLDAPAGRLERVSSDEDQIWALVDYAHTDDALARTLRATREAMPADAELWVVFGCGGDRDTTKRPLMGRAAAELADRVVVTSDNPRSEPPGEIVKQILAGMTATQRGRAAVHIERERAIQHAIEQAPRGSVVVIAGKGHEREQIVAGPGGVLESRPFDDRAVARAWLKRRRTHETKSGTKPAAAAGSGRADA